MLAVLFFVHLAAASASDAPATERILLRLKPPAGRTYNLRLIYEQKVSRGSEGREAAAEQSLSIDYSFLVEKVDPKGVSTVKATYRAVRFAQSGSEGKANWDSARPSSPVPPAVESFARLVGRSFLARILPDGEIEEIEGGNLEIVKAIMAVYPSKPVGVGDFWRKKITISQGIPMILESTFILARRREGMAIVDVRSRIRNKLGLLSLGLGPLNLGYNLTGEQEGTLELEESSGWPIRVKIRQTYEGQFRVGATGALSGGLSSPVHVVSTLTIEPF